MPSRAAAPWLRRGQAELREGRDAAAAEHFLKALAEDPGSETVLMHLGEIFARQGRHERAVSFFTQAARRNPRSAKAFAFMSQLKRRLGATEEGLEDFAVAVALDQRSLWMLSLGYGRVDNKPLYGRELAALDALVKKRPDWGLAHVARGVARAHARERELDLVAADIRRGMALDPSCRWALAWLGEAHRWEHEYEAALPLLDEAVKDRPGDPDLWIRRGETKVWTGAFEEAVRDFDRAVELEPRVGSHVAWRAEIKLWGGDYKGALVDAERSLLCAAPALWAHCWIGGARHLLGKPALAELDTALARDPVDAEALTFRGEARRLAGMMEDSLQDLDKAISLRPFATSFINRSLTLSALGKKKEAMADAEEFRRLAPALSKAAKNDLERALELSLGNRTAHPSFGERKGGKLYLRSAA